MLETLTKIHRDPWILDLAEKNLTDECYRLWGRALGNLLPKMSAFVVTCDNRHHSAIYKNALVSGLLNEGIRVIDVGCKPTDVAVFAYNAIKAEGFASVTGDVQAPEINGLRWMLDRSARSHREQVAFLKKFEKKHGHLPEDETKTAGMFRQWDPTEEWTFWLRQIWYDTPNVLLKVVLDPMNGCWSRLAEPALASVFPSFDFDTVNDDPNKPFAAGISYRRRDPALTTLRSRIRACQADVGFALEPDSGRVLLVDDRGDLMTHEEVCGLYLEMLGEAMDDEIFLHDKHCSPGNLNRGKYYGGIPELVTGGEPSFVAEMKRLNALVGFDCEGRVYFRGALGNRIVTFGICWILDYLAHLRRPLSAWRSRFAKA